MGVTLVAPNQSCPWRRPGSTPCRLIDGVREVMSGGARQCCGGLNTAQHLDEQILRREALGEGDPDTAHTDADVGTELEQTRADGAALSLGQLGLLESQATQGAQQDVGEGAEVEPDLIGQQGVGAGAVGEQVELLLLDPILHLAAGAVEIFVESPCIGCLAAERGDDIARIGSLGEMLGLDHDPARAAPAVARAVVEFIEHPAGPFRLEEALLGPATGLEAQGIESIVLGQAKHEVDVGPRTRP